MVAAEWRAADSFEQGLSEPLPRTIRDLQHTHTLEAEEIEFLFDGEEAVGVRKRRF